MCGICGKIALDDVRSEDIQTMVDVLRHRGPDDQGLFVSSGADLGHCRLSIIDLK